MGDLVGEADTLAALLEPRITIDNELLAPPEKVEGDNMNSVNSHSAATDSELSQVPDAVDVSTPRINSQSQGNGALENSDTAASETTHQSSQVPDPVDVSTPCISSQNLSNDALMLKINADADEDKGEKLPPPSTSTSDNNATPLKKQWKHPALFNRNTPLHRRTRSGAARSIIPAPENWLKDELVVLRAENVQLKNAVDTLERTNAEQNEVLTEFRAQLEFMKLQVKEIKETILRWNVLLSFMFYKS